MSDGELVRQTLAGRAQAYEELVRRWAGRITALCHARVHCAATAQDMAQEALLRGYRALASLIEPEKFGPWLCGIAQRTCLDWLKAKERRQVPFSVLAPDHDVEPMLPARPDTEDAAQERAEEIHELLAAVAALPDEYREVILLYYYGEGTYRDLAETLGVSTATVNARLTKARALLRQALGGRIER